MFTHRITLSLPIFALAIMACSDSATNIDSYASRSVTFPTYDFDTTLAFPNAAGTVANDINSQGDVVGIWINGSGQIRGLYYDGSYDTVEYPGAVNTFAQGIDELGNIYGDYSDINGDQHGFIRSSGGTYTSFDFPDAVMTYVFDANGSGTVVGTFVDTNDVRMGYVRQFSGTFADVFKSGSYETGVSAINDGGDLLSWYYASVSAGKDEWDPNGPRFFPDHPTAMETFWEGWNNDELVCGQQFDTNSSFPNGYNPDAPTGFLYKDSTFVDFDVPGSIHTGPINMNDEGVIVGFFDNADGDRKPFIATPQ